MPRFTEKNEHCSYCGSYFTKLSWPRTCVVCSNVSYLNPMPVSVMLLPTYDNGLLVTKRAIEPGKGKWAFCSGFAGIGETAAQTAAREVLEEIGIARAPEEFKYYDQVAVEARHLLLTFLMLKHPLTPPEIESFRPTDEVSDVKKIYCPEELAFSAHTEMVRRYSAGDRG